MPLDARSRGGRTPECLPPRTCAPTGAPAARATWNCGHRDEQARGDDRGNDGQLDARNVHWTGVPARIDSMTSMIAWVDVVESTPEMSESCVAAAMTR